MTKLLRTGAMAALLASLVVGPLAAPANAQGGSACTGQTSGGGRDRGTQGNQRQAGGQALGGLIDVAVQNVQALNNVDALNNVLRGANLQVLCLNDVLNGNDVRLLNNILQNSEVLSRNSNFLNDNTVLRDFLNRNNIANGVQVLAVNTGNISPTVGSEALRLLSADAQRGGMGTVYVLNARERGNNNDNDDD